MADSEILSDTIEAIYGLALNEEQWITALEKINTLIGGEGTFFLRATFEGKVLVDEVRDQGIIQGNWDTYAEVAHNDPKVPLLLRMPYLGVISDYEFITEREMDRHPFYQRLLFPQNLRYMVGAKLPAAPQEHVFLAVHRASDRGHVERREIRLMQPLARHVSQAAEVGRRLHILTRRSNRYLTQRKRFSDAGSNF